MLRILIACLLALAACADAAAAIDPPSRVARLSYVRGPVSFSPAGTGDWAAASLNRPVIAGDRLWTDNRGRGELQLGGAALRMDDDTLVTMLTLDDRVLQVQLAQGTLGVRVRPGGTAGTVEVDTPNLAMTMQQPGHYRVSVDPAGHATVVRVDDGLAQVYGQDQAYQINPGQAFRFVGPDLRNVQALDPRQRDDFDRWSATRDRRAERSVARRYVPPAMIGAEDLDDYGNWRTVPGYGPVWMPVQVERGWAPYRDGHWAWIEPWGWTWIDDAPWGFAVTHYGRWANFGGNWGWVPGPARAEPVYAPALVVFTAAASLMAPSSHREPAVAWFPLGPREAYRPPYPASPRYVAAINNTTNVVNNTTNVVNNIYINRQAKGAITAVPGSVFTRARPVRPAAVALSKEAVARSPVTARPPVAAQRESHAIRLGAGHRPAPALLAQPVMTHMRPAIAAAQVQARPNIAPLRQATHGATPAPVPRTADGRVLTAVPQPKAAAQPPAGQPSPQTFAPATAHANRFPAGASRNAGQARPAASHSAQATSHHEASPAPAAVHREAPHFAPAAMHREAPHPAPAAVHREAPHPAQAPVHREAPHPVPATAHREPAHSASAPPQRNLAPPAPVPAPPHREPPPHAAPAAPAAAQHDPARQHGPDPHKDGHR